MNQEQLGPTSVVLSGLMIPLGFVTTTTMVRRGFDLSGDQHVDPHALDAATASLGNLSALVGFIILAVAAIAYRRRRHVHTRLMLFANISLITPVAADYLIEKRIRFLTAATAIGWVAFQRLVIFVISPSSARHRFAEWMSQWSARKVPNRQNLHS